MNRLEKNLVESFRRARSDIIKLQEQVMQLAQNQSKLMEDLYNKKPARKSTSRKKKSR